MHQFLGKGMLALGALMILTLAGPSAQADMFTFGGINTGVTSTVNVARSDYTPHLRSLNPQPWLC